MCGICGVSHPHLEKEALRKLVSAMSASLAHRGPDGNGVTLLSGVAFAHRRLSIIDLGVGGAQPMLDKRGYLLTYNGELYNYLELRRELELEGEQFITNSDTEVILKAFVRWGEKCLDRFNGMYAFAIYDKNRDSLFLARDRIGIKPLYYVVDNNGFSFASEIKALLVDKNIDCSPDLSLIPYFLSYGYFPRQYTAYKSIRQLKPGHWIRWQKGKMTERCYWNAADYVDPEGGCRVDNLELQELGELVKDSINMQTVADVPVGTFLSGGLDSGLVTAHLARMGDESIKTFTVGVQGDPAMDESKLARQVSDYYRTDHHQIQVSANDLLHNWDKVFNHFDQPFVDTSALPTYLISRFAREHVKVVLSGDGGDEQWGGYGNYQRYLQLHNIKNYLPGPLASIGANAAFLGAGLMSRSNPRFAQRLSYYGGLLKTDIAGWSGALDRHIDASVLRKLAGDRLYPELEGVRSPEIFTRNEEALHLDGVMLGNLQLFMVDDVLRKVDMMSMLAGIEVRVPLLDHRLVERSLSLSWREKVTRSETKILGRRLASKLLPETILTAKKQGFSIPLDNWFRGELKPMLGDVLGSRACRERGIFNPDVVEKLCQDHFSGRAHHGKTLMSLLSLEKWFERNDGAA